MHRQHRANAERDGCEAEKRRRRRGCAAAAAAAAQGRVHHERTVREYTTHAARPGRMRRGCAVHRCTTSSYEQTVALSAE
jgi:hypothetical protein